MIKRTLMASTVALWAMLAGSPAMAHHSANAQFDTSKEFELTGVLAKLENINPHSWWHVDITDANGKVTRWRLESLSPNGLIRQGIRVKDDIKVGGTYTFTIAPAWKDPAMGFMKAITVNGRKVKIVDL